MPRSAFMRSWVQLVYQRILHYNEIIARSWLDSLSYCLGQETAASFSILPAWWLHIERTECSDLLSMVSIDFWIFYFAVSWEPFESVRLWWQALILACLSKRWPADPKLHLRIPWAYRKKSISGFLNLEGNISGEPSRQSTAVIVHRKTSLPPCNSLFSLYLHAIIHHSSLRSTIDTINTHSSCY